MLNMRIFFEYNLVEERKTDFGKGLIIGVNINN